MTTILGLRSGGVSYLAADSRCLSSETILPSRASKLIEVGPWRIGISGNRRVNHAIEMCRENILGQPSPGGLAVAIREALIADGFGRTSDPGSAAFGSMAMIFASEAGVWHLGNDFGYAELEDGRPWGCGSGGCHAEGACTALLDAGLEPAVAMAKAVRIASLYDPGTDDRVDIVALTDHVQVAGRLLRGEGFPEPLASTHGPNGGA